MHGNNKPTSEEDSHETHNHTEESSSSSRKVTLAVKRCVARVNLSESGRHRK